MERGMKRSLCSIGVLFAVALSFMTCSNPIDILKSVTNEVKRSNAKFLVVKGLQSPIGTASVNPGTPITIEFDRPVNASTVSSSTITVTPSNGTSIKYSLTIDYSNANKTVTLTPKPFLEDTTQYDVTVTTGVLGDDASELEAPMSWSFKTGVYPAGDITFTDGTHTPDGLGYNKINYIGAVSPLQLWINYKAVVDKYRMSTSPTAFGSFQDANLGWVAPTFGSGDVYTPPAIALPAGDGTKTIYIQFLRTSNGGCIARGN